MATVAMANAATVEIVPITTTGAIRIDDLIAVSNIITSRATTIVSIELFHPNLTSNHHSAMLAMIVTIIIAVMRVTTLIIPAARTAVVALNYGQSIEASYTKVA